MDNNAFDDIHDSALDGWGFSFRRSQLYRFKKYLDMLIKNNIKGKILEIACSTGFFTNLMSNSIKNIEIKAVDISQIAIDKAKKKYPNIDFSVQKLPDVNFEGESFDCVTAIEVLSYLDDEGRMQSIANIRNILKDDGYAIISVNIGEKPYFKLDEIRNLVSDKFEIIYEDGLYIKTYYKYIETPIWIILDMFSSYKKIIIKPVDGFLKRSSKNILNFTIKNKIVFYTIGFLIRKICIGALYFMPIYIIDKVSKFISKNEQDVYICLCKARKREG